jgi:anti-anti-sigma regulatory factor
MMTTEAHAGHGPLIILANGTFDVPAAERVARELQAAAGLEVRIDLTQVRDFHDFGVAVLARALVARRQVDVRGLRTHQLRLLKYLGIDALAEPAHASDAHPA